MSSKAEEWAASPEPPSERAEKIMTERDEYWASCMAGREELQKGLDSHDPRPMEMIAIIADAIEQMLGVDDDRIVAALEVAADELPGVTMTTSGNRTN
jgi:hypothetical protein